MTSGAVKKEEKVEKRRALGRGLESLLPGPRVVGSPESRVGSPESRVASPERGSAAQGLKPENSAAMSGSSLRQDSGQGSEQAPEAVPFPVSGTEATAVDPGLEPLPSQEVEAGRTGAPGQDGQLQHQAAASAGQPGAAVPTLEQYEPEVISIQAEAMPGSLVAELDMGLIDENPYQTRYVFDGDMMRELRDSIKEHGVVQPVVVRPAAVEGRYILVLGERRLRASKMAGKDTIPALIRRLSPQQAAEMTVLENIVREDLNPLEQAEAFRVLSTEFKLTQFQIAQRVGVSRETVSNYMRLLRLPEKVMNYMLEGELSFSDAREILRLEKPEHVEMVAEEIIKKRLKWDEIEERINRLNEPFYTVPGPQEPPKGRGARWQDPNVRAAQTEMERTLGMRVRIRDRNGTGRIVIEYANVDDYERVVEMLRGKKK